MKKRKVPVSRIEALEMEAARLDPKAGRLWDETNAIAIQTGLNRKLAKALKYYEQALALQTQIQKLRETEALLPEQAHQANAQQVETKAVQTCAVERPPLKRGGILIQPFERLYDSAHPINRDKGSE